MGTSSWFSFTVANIGNININWTSLVLDSSPWVSIPLNSKETYIGQVDNLNLTFSVSLQTVPSLILQQVFPHPTPLHVSENHQHQTPNNIQTTVKITAPGQSAILIPISLLPTPGPISPQNTQYQINSTVSILLSYHCF